jgi:hypothetical protein
MSERQMRQFGSSEGCEWRIHSVANAGCRRELHAIPHPGSTRINACVYL